jgi:phosphoenolpyruvate carboxykinase (ATP)
VDAIHSGALASTRTERDPIFGVGVPVECHGVPQDILQPRGVWPDTSAYDAMARKLAGLFQANFKQYEPGVSAEIKGAGPS